MYKILTVLQHHMLANSFCFPIFLVDTRASYKVCYVRYSKYTHKLCRVLKKITEATSSNINVTQLLKIGWREGLATWETKIELTWRDQGYGWIRITTLTGPTLVCLVTLCIVLHAAIIERRDWSSSCSSSIPIFLLSPLLLTQPYLLHWVTSLNKPA